MAARTTSRESNTLEMLDKRVSRRFDIRPERLAYESLCLTCLMFYAGRQRFRLIDGQIFNPPYEDNGIETQYKVNLIFARVISAVSKILGIHAEFAVTPESGSARHRELAELSERYFNHVRDAAESRQVDILSQLQAAIFGSSFIKVQWNPRMGEPDRFYYETEGSDAVIPESMLSRPQRDEKLAQGLFKDQPTGDVEFSVVMPFAFHHDWDARDGGIRKCQWVAEKHYVSRGLLAEAFGIDEDDLQPEGASAGITAYEEAIAYASTGGGNMPFSYEAPRDKIGERCMFIEMWERPNAHYKRGRRLCWGGGRVLLDTDNPHLADRTGWAHLPYVKKDWAPQPGRFWAKGLVEELLTPQFYLNDLISRQIEFARFYGMPNTFIGDQAGIRADEIEEGGGRSYQVSEASSFKVQHGPPPQMPVEVGNTRIQIEGDVNKLAAQAESDGSKLPGQMRSGSAIKQMNEERFIGLNIPGELYVMAARDQGRIALALGQMFCVPNRLMRYLGEDNDWVVEEFAGMDLRNDVIILGTPSMTDTLDNQKQEMLDAISAGAFNPMFPPEVQRMIISGLHYNNSEEFVKAALQAKRNQESEIQEMIRDPLKWGPSGYPVMEWEDHEAEAAACVRYMYTPDFKKLQPLVRGLITQHWKMHNEFLLQRQLQEAMMAASQKGAPGEKGMASQPGPK